MIFPNTTRLRFISAKKPEALVKFCDSVGKRIEIKQIIFDGSRWFLWFIPDDRKTDIPSGHLKDEVNSGTRAKSRKG